MKRLIKIFTSALIAGAMLCTTFATPASFYNESNSSQIEVKAAFQPFNAILIRDSNIIDGSGKKLYSKPIGTLIAVVDEKNNYGKVSYDVDQWININNIKAIPANDANKLFHYNHNKHISSTCPTIEKITLNDHGLKLHDLNNNSSFLTSYYSKPFNGFPVNSHYISIEKTYKLDYKEGGEMIALYEPKGDYFTYSGQIPSIIAHFSVKTVKSYNCPICHCKCELSCEMSEVTIHCWSETQAEAYRKQQEDAANNAGKLADSKSNSNKDSKNKTPNGKTSSKKKSK